VSLLLVLLLACGRDPALERPVDIPTVPAPAADPRAPVKAPPPSGLALASAMEHILADEPPCMGRFARVEVWRTPKGDVHRLFFHGDMQCSHPPSVWYDPSGSRLEVVAEEPVTEANREHYAAIWARHTTGAEKAETLHFSE